MKVSGFTIARNAVKFNYPILESIRSILPLCDEFIVNVGDSEDETPALIQSLNDPKIRIIRTVWDFGMGKEVLSYQTNAALAECRGDWAFYLQSDEVVHEDDLPVLRKCMQKGLTADVDALRFKWLHFYGSYYRYRIDRGWYQKQDRIIRNNGTIESQGDAWGFQKKDGSPIRRLNTGCFIYHYGWVQPEAVMAARRMNAEHIGFVSLKENERKHAYDYGNLRRFPVYFGSHPAVMKSKVDDHPLSRADWKDIRSQHAFHPLRFLRWRYKTSRRVKQAL